MSDEKEPTNAWEELQAILQPDERVEAIVFGPWGWGHEPYKPGYAWEPGYGEPSPPPVPFELRGKILAAEEARPLMQSWRFSGGFGSPECYAVRIWTTSRVLWVTEYDGSTSLDDAPRHPIGHMPSMPGGG